MDKKLIFVMVVASLLLFSNMGSAESSYADIQVYYNDNLYPGASTPKPVVKIGEPFTLRFDVTAYQECRLVAKISDLGTGVGMENFVVIDGPSKLGDKDVRIFMKDEMYTYEWTLKATENWAGGSMPIDFIYSAVLKGESESLFKGEFTAAYVTISDEYYDGPEYVPSSESQSNASSSNSTPGFTMLVASLAMLGVTLTKRMIR
jgi:sarcinarray family protein